MSNLNLSLGGTKINSIEDLNNVSELQFKEGDSVQLRFAILMLLLAEKQGIQADEAVDNLEAAKVLQTEANNYLAILNEHNPLGENENCFIPESYKDLFTKLDIPFPTANGESITTGSYNGVNGIRLNTQEELDAYIAKFESAVSDIGVNLNNLSSLVTAELGLLNTYITGAASTNSSLATTLQNIISKI